MLTLIAALYVLVPGLICLLSAALSSACRVTPALDDSSPESRLERQRDVYTRLACDYYVAWCSYAHVDDFAAARCLAMARWYETRADALAELIDALVATDGATCTEM